MGVIKGGPAFREEMESARGRRGGAGKAARSEAEVLPDGSGTVPPQWRKAEKSTHRGGCSDACRAVGSVGSPYREPMEDLHGQRFHFVSCALF